MGPKVTPASVCGNGRGLVQINEFINNINFSANDELGMNPQKTMTYRIKWSDMQRKEYKMNGHA